MGKKFLILLISLPSLLLTSCGDKKELTVLAAAGLKEPFSQAVESYEKKHPEVDIKVVYAGSGSLLVKLKNRLGDLYIPAAESYIKTAVGEGLVDPQTVKVLAYHRAVLVSKKPIEDIYSFYKVCSRIGISDPKEAAIGKVTYGLLTKMGLWEKIQPKVAVKTSTVNQLLLYLQNGQIDCAIIWKELAKKLKGFTVIEFPQRLGGLEKIPVGVTTFSSDPQLAKDFENFLLRNREVFRKYGFE
jgi:molybdate transport system substrate-binding protein